MIKGDNMKKKYGFTLVEIKVVVAILAALMAVAVPSILKYVTITDEVKARNEAYACVTASNYFGAKAYQFKHFKRKNSNSSKTIYKESSKLSFFI